MSRGVQLCCDDCLVPLNVINLLVKCPSLEDLQERYCRGEDGSFRLPKILGGKCVSPGHKLLIFIEKAGLLHQI